MCPLMCCVLYAGGRQGKEKACMQAGRHAVFFCFAVLYVLHTVGKVRYSKVKGKGSYCSVSFIVSFVDLFS